MWEPEYIRALRALPPDVPKEIAKAIVAEDERAARAARGVGAWMAAALLAALIGGGLAYLQYWGMGR